MKIDVQCDEWISEYIWITCKLEPTPDWCLGSSCARWRNRCLFQGHKRGSKAKVTESTWKVHERYLLHPGTVDIVIVIVFVWVTGVDTLANILFRSRNILAAAGAGPTVVLTIQPFSQDNMRIHTRIHEYYVHIQGSYMHSFSPQHYGRVSKTCHADIMPFTDPSCRACDPWCSCLLRVIAPNDGIAPCLRRHDETKGPRKGTLDDLMDLDGSWISRIWMDLDGSRWILVALSEDVRSD